MPLRVEDLVRPVECVAPTAGASDVLGLFLADPELDAVPVVFGRTLVGTVSRLGAMTALAQARGAPLRFQSLIETAAPVAAVGTPLGKVASDLSAADQMRGLAGIAVISDGAYVGFVPAAVFLDALASENKTRARMLVAARRKLEAQTDALAVARRQEAVSLARLGHEVRTPLTAILGHAERLSRKDITSDAREHANTIARASEALAELVNRAVEAGRAAQTEANTSTPFSLKAMLADQVALWTPAAEEKQLSLELDYGRSAPERIEGDETRLRQIVANLLSNAIKYTDSGQVTLSVGGEAHGDAIALTLSVADTGIGIAPGHVGELFTPFTRFSENRDGTGLGLHVTDALVTSMGGVIDFAPRQGGGSVFTVSLSVLRAGPRLASEGERPERPRRMAFELGDILLVEDHGASQALIEDALKSAGWQVDTVATLAQARRRADHKPYQAILCDFHLADGSGDLLLKALRAGAGPNRDTLCLVVTADASAARRQYCVGIGFAGVIAKPIREGDLITRLIDHINDADKAEARARA